ncbi:MAG: hypothetical protein ACAI25_08470, partial [Planctomycetota bacterium]
LGLASVRARSRFADGWVEALLPFLPPTERALAGWTVSLRGTTGVTLEAEEVKVELDLDGRGLVTRKRVFAGGLLVSDVSVESEVRLSEPTEAASFAPQLDGYVLVEMPARTIAHRQEQLQKLAPEKGAERLFLMDQLAFTNHLSHQWVSHAKDTRRGIQVLRLAVNQISKDTVDSVVKAEPELGAYAKCHFEPRNVERTKGFVLLAKELGSGFFASMARYGAAQNGLYSVYETKSASSRAEAIEHVRRYVDDRPRSPLVVSLAQFVSVYGVAYTFSVDEIVRIFDLIRDSNADAAGIRLLCAHFLQANGKSEDAARHFEAGYRLAMEKGEFPPFTQALPAALGEKRFQAFVERALEWAASRPFALTRIVASAVNAATAVRAIKLLPEPMPSVLVRELARSPFVHNATTDERVQILEALLAKPSLAKEKWLHASAGHLAHQQGLAGAAARHFEAALALEKGVANLAEVRQTILNLFQDYATIAAATSVPGQSNAVLVARVLASLELAGRLDPQDTNAYVEAARVFQLCGERALLLEAATTPIALKPAEGAAHSTTAATLAKLGDHALAATLYGRAAVLEPQDPTPLWNEASERVVLGEQEAAKALYKKIATGKWHERFLSIVQSATQRQ